MQLPLSGTLMNKSKVHLEPLLQEDSPDFYITPTFFTIFVLIHLLLVGTLTSFQIITTPVYICHSSWLSGGQGMHLIHLFTESLAQGLTPEKHSVHMGKKTAKIFRSQSVSALPCYETPVSLSIHWMLLRAFMWLMTLHFYSNGNKRCWDLKCPPVYPHHQEFIKPNTHVTIIFTAFQITG